MNRHYKYNISAGLELSIHYWGWAGSIFICNAAFTSCESDRKNDLSTSEEGSRARSSRGNAITILTIDSRNRGHFC